MRKVVVYQLLSLDGVAEKPETLVAEWGEVMDANLATIIAAQDAVVLGRRSFDEWSRYWPDSADIGVHASISVAQSLLRAGVVDELGLVVAPAVAGGGRGLLDALPPLRLESLRATRSPTGSLLGDYRVVGSGA